MTGPDPWKPSGTVAWQEGPGGKESRRGAIPGGGEVRRGTGSDPALKTMRGMNSEARGGDGWGWGGQHGRAGRRNRGGCKPNSRSGEEQSGR